MTTALSPEQYNALARAIDPARIQELRGQHYLQAWDVRRWLIRIFGFDGFDLDTVELVLVREIEQPPGSVTVTRWVNNVKTEVPTERTTWTVVYRAQVRLVIKVDGREIAHFDDASAGDSSNQPSLGDAHDHAMKTALSQALKRCCVNLGDQFGLGLYNGGRPDAVVIRSVVTPAGDAAPAAELPTGDVVLPEPDDAAPVSAPPAGQVDAVAAGLGGAVAAAVAARQPEPPAETSPAGAPPMAEGQKRRMFALFNALGHAEDRERQVAFMVWALRRPVSHRDDLTAEEAATVIAALEARRQEREQRARQPVGA